MKKLIITTLLLLPIMAFSQNISYLWSTGDTTATINVNPTVTTTYYVTVTQYGVSYLDSMTIQVNTPSFSSSSQTACNIYTWPVNNQIYTASGTYVDTLTNAAGCDSVVTLNLTINQSSTGSESITACNTYTWPANSQTYTSSGAYTATLTNAAGCDSVVTLNLTINQSTTGAENITACNTYTWPANNQTYTSSGAYTTTLTNAAGCDSVVTLNLMINQSSVGSETVTAVQSYTWSTNNQTYTSSGAYTATLANVAGCDSVITLNLTIVPPLVLTTTASDTVICEGSSVTIGVNAAPDVLIGQYRPGTVHCDPNSPTAVVDVTNPITGKTWMDRNLGASRVAQSSTDTLAYGDLYQWGRRADGHQCRNSATTTTLSSSDQLGHGDFIIVANFPNDWRSPQNTNLWQGVNGINNPCPNGYRLPTETELNAERVSWSSNNAAGAFNSPLKLPLSGLRSTFNGLLYDAGNNGHYWSSSYISNHHQTNNFNFSSSGANVSSGSRAAGLAIRCIKD